MIDQCGWKGKALGPAAVHDKQALVLVNRGGAKGSDIIALSDAVRASVRAKFGIDIHPEVNLVEKMKVRILGSGTSTGVPQIGCTCPVCTSADPKDNRLRTSAIVETGDARILIDCGPDFRTQVLRLPFERIDGVLITHEHYDHVGGLDDLRPFCRFGSVPIYAEHYVSHALRLRMPYCFVDHRYPGVPDIPLQEISVGQNSL